MPSGDEEARLGESGVRHVFILATSVRGAGGDSEESGWDCGRFSVALSLPDDHERSAVKASAVDSGPFTNDFENRVLPVVD